MINKKLYYNFPAVWKAIFQLYAQVYNGKGTKGVGDSVFEEMLGIYNGAVERGYYPKSFPKVWRALRMICKMYGVENPGDESGIITNGEDSNSWF